MTKIPECCAFPLVSTFGDTYVCVTCHTVYHHLIGGWAIADNDTGFAREMEDAVAPKLHNDDYVPPAPHAWAPSGPDDQAGFGKWPERPYEQQLDEDERTGY